MSKNNELYSSINHNHEFSDIFKEFEEEETIEEEDGEIVNKARIIINNILSENQKANSVNTLA